MKSLGRQVAGVLGAVTVTLVTGACAQKNISPYPSISEESRARLGSPVNCKTARQDIRLLEAERTTTRQRMAAGARAIFPISAVAGLLSGDYSDRVAVATGQYDNDIAVKIDEIRTACRLRK